MTDETTEYLKQVVLGDPAEHCEIVLVPYDPEWPQRFHEEAAKIRSALPANDRRRYEDLKRELASQPWATVQHYADAKTDLIEELLARARAEESTD